MDQDRTPYLGAALASLAVFFIYVLTLAPTAAFWDASEYIATAHILGIPHPPGNPLFVALGRVWILLLSPIDFLMNLESSVAVRVNLFAAATSALAGGFFFLFVHRIAKGLDRGPIFPWVAAGAAVLVGGTAFTVWYQSNVNEKVYTLAVLVIAAVSWLAVRWRDRKDEPGSVRYLVLAVYLMILGSTNHLMALLPAPALGLYVLMVQPRVLLRRDLLTRGALAVVVGLSFNFFLPIRADQNPIINEGHPACESMVEAAVAVYSLGRAGCDELADNLTREQYGKPSVFTDPTSPDPMNPEPRGLGLMGHQLLNYFQYFDWQWARGLDAADLPGSRRLPVTLLFLGLGLVGLRAVYVSDRDTFWYALALAGTLTVGLVFYLNFRYGWSLAGEEIPRQMREVRERDYFFIAGFMFWGVLAGTGLAYVWDEAANRIQDARARLYAAPILAVAFIPLVFNWGWADRSYDYAARDWAYNLLQSTAPYSVLFTNGDNDTFPLWYLQEVEGIRQDVTVVVVQYLFTEWYPKQIQYHTSPERQRPFREERDTGLHPVPGQPPSSPVIGLSHDDMDAIVGGTLQQESVFDLGELALQFQAGTFLSRGDRMALAMIRDSLGERPIYFASTGGLPESLGLTDHVIREGIAARLETGDPEQEGVVRLPQELGGEWLDFERSRTLAEEVFTYRALADRDIWADRPTLNIPWHFYFLHLQLAEAAGRMGVEEEAVNRFVDSAESFLVTARGGRLAPQANP